MNIAVLLKLVSKSHFTDSIADAPKDRLATGQLAINPADEYALEMALRIKDEFPKTVVTVVTMAPDSAMHILYEAMAMGADESVIVTDRAFAGSDTLATAKIIAAATEKLPKQDLILCGQRAIDSETGQIGPRLAELLGLPVCTNTLTIEYEKKPRKNGAFRISRLQDDGTVDIKVCGPLIVTMCRGVEMVRAATILGMQRARKAETLKLTNAELCVDTSVVGLNGSPTKVLKTKMITYPGRGKAGTDDVSCGADEFCKIIGKEKEKNE